LAKAKALKRGFEKDEQEGEVDAWAVTFKDGKVSKDNQIEEPAENVE
jgi:hypothetical protein